MSGQWAGDEDLGCGNLQAMFKDYKVRCTAVKNLGSSSRWGNLLPDLIGTQQVLLDDSVFLKEGERVAKRSYEKALEGSHTSDSLLMELSWDVIGFEELLKQVKQLEDDITMLIQDIKSDPHQAIIKDKLIKLRTSMLSYLHGLFSKKRSAASHLLIFMISDELRNHKPYAVPVRFLSYKSITDGKLRELEIEVENAMKDIGMVVVGFTTNGEFNSLRTMGKKRALSVIELAKNAKNEAKKMRAATVSNYFKLDEFGNPKAQHPAVPIEDVKWLDDFMRADPTVPFERAIHILRRSLFPFCYDPCGWVAGRPETESEVLKSIMAIYLYRLKVNQLKYGNDPADFSKYLYQPERDESTSELVHHREDHNHLLKRIVKCLRDGLIPGLNMQYMKQALHDPTTGLTYEALTGKNKQSVPDCETLISSGVIRYLERRGHLSGARVLKIIHNWHKAVDGQGLGEVQRSSYCKDMKDWLLDEWIPWHRQIKDYALLDVNKPLKGICGLTREVVVGLIANLESQELRRQEYVAHQLPPEHPRSSSTDDVEGFIALLHEMLGAVFDLKQFYSELPKILNEFSKWINPDLPFFYWTGAKQRYRDFEMPGFNEPSGPGVIERLDRVQLSRRGDPGVFVANRASLPQRGQLTARAQFHKAPIALPPPS